MLWILLAVAICAVDLGIKHYIDTHKEENCYEPAVGGRIIITRFHNPGAMLGWMKKKPKMLMGITLLGIGGAGRRFDGGAVQEAVAVD